MMSFATSYLASSYIDFGKNISPQKKRFNRWDLTVLIFFISSNEIAFNIHCCFSKQIYVLCLKLKLEINSQNDLN